MTTPATFIDAFDGFIVDADGVLYRGSAPVPYAIDAMTEVAQSRPWCVVTNNAANAPGVVAEKLRGLGLAADDGNVVTSPQGAAVFLAQHHIAASAHVFVVGGAGIDHALLEAGFVPVREPDPSAVAVVQGLGMEVCWNDLANAGYAIQSGALWVATNPDTSLPTEQGLAPGNGALVAALSATLGRQPDAVTGKPEPLLFEVAAERLGAGTALVIGDRVDTDIRGANRAGMESL
ncbi:MAG: HAD family hydrolase, partial [Actinomycetota bacterium]|nr:HAD family hydrolase [Actinomycetota bacterium]